MTENEKKQLRNHLPTVRSLINIFLSCLDAKEMDESIEKNYLIEMIDKMEEILAESKIIVNQ